jgi:hypothetical protein
MGGTADAARGASAPPCLRHLRKDGGMGMIETEPEVVTVSSRDGTAIACHRSGTGPPLVLVHGTGGSGARWGPLLPSAHGSFHGLRDGPSWPRAERRHPAVRDRARVRVRRGGRGRDRPAREPPRAQHGGMGRINRSGSESEIPRPAGGSCLGRFDYSAVVAQIGGRDATRLTSSRVTMGSSFAEPEGRPVGRPSEPPAGAARTSGGRGEVGDSALQRGCDGS